MPELFLVALPLVLTAESKVRYLYLSYARKNLWYPGQMKTCLRLQIVGNFYFNLFLFWNMTTSHEIQVTSIGVSVSTDTNGKCFSNGKCYVEYHGKCFVCLISAHFTSKWRQVTCKRYCRWNCWKWPCSTKVSFKRAYQLLWSWAVS